MRVCAVLGLALGLGCSVAGAAEIRALQRDFTGEVRAIETEDGALVVRTTRDDVPLREVKSIRFQDPAPATSGVATILLTNGDTLRGTAPSGDMDGLTLRTVGLGQLNLGLELVRAMVFDGDIQRLDGLDPEQQWDIVTMRDGASAEGSLTTVSPGRVQINTNVGGGGGMGVLTFDTPQVDWISIAVLDDPIPTPDDLHVILRLIDGSSLRGRLLGLQEGRVQLEHPLGDGDPLEIATPRIAELVVQNGAFVYLSDLTPREFEQGFPPAFEYDAERWTFKLDRNVLGEPLSLGGELYEKGLGVHSYCALVYELGGQFRQFRSVIGLDDSTRHLGEPGFGAVVFKVLVDGQPAREYPNGVTMHKGQEPVTLEVDLGEAQTLTIVADVHPTSLHILGRANWADAHLIRR